MGYLCGIPGGLLLVLAGLIDVITLVGVSIAIARRRYVSSVPLLSLILIWLAMIFTENCSGGLKLSWPIFAAWCGLHLLVHFILPMIADRLAKKNVDS